MKNLEQIVLYMKEEINQQADAQISHILKEVDEIKQNELAKVQHDAKNEAQLHMSAAKRKLMSDKALTLSRFNSDKTRTLIEKREEYTKLLFAEAKSRLIEFSKSAEYKEFIERKISNYSFDDEVDVYVRKDDLILKDLFEKQWKCNVLEGNVEIGGFIVDTKSSQRIDETFETALKDQRVWFEDHSMMIL